MSLVENSLGAPSRTPAEIEREWFETVYQGDRQPQLTARAAMMGMLLGMVLSVSNLYLGLKTGSIGYSATTSCVLAYAAFAMLHRIFPRWFPPFQILENNAMQSCASAAGIMATSGLVSAIPALMMIDPAAFPSNHWWLALWIVAVSMLGVFLAVPAKRQIINIEQLPFPDGIAAAATMKSLHGDQSTAGRQTRALGVAATLAAAVAWFRDAAWASMPYTNIPSYWGTSWVSVGGYSLMDLTVAFEGSFLYVAFGALIGLRQAASLLLGALVNYVILAPIMLNQHVIARASYPSIVSWSLWIGVPMLVTSSLVVLGLQWRTTLRAFSSIVATIGGRSADADDPMARIEVPGSWFTIGFLACGALTIWLGAMLFHIAWWMGVIAVLSCFLLVIVAARATGETGQTPAGPLSKITQFTFGAIDPTRTATNLMTANITAGATAHASDLLGDLKSGYLLGANPRQQFLAQVLGVLAGGLVVVPVFFVLIPDASFLGTARWPAPGAIVWKGVAELVTHGFGALDPTARVGFAIGAAVGIVLPLLEAAFPNYRRYIPSATGIGVAFTIPAFACMSMCIGAIAADWFRKTRPKLAEEFTVPVASGLIVGESLMGVLIALLIIKGWLS